MCLALPAKIVEREENTGWVVLGDSRMRVDLIMTPEAQLGDWVLVHAGFAIQTVDEADALETWRIISSIETEPEEAAT